MQTRKWYIWWSDFEKDFIKAAFRGLRCSFFPTDCLDFSSQRPSAEMHCNPWSAGFSGLLTWPLGRYRCETNALVFSLHSDKFLLGTKALQLLEVHVNLMRIIFRWLYLMYSKWGGTLSKICFYLKCIFYHCYWPGLSLLSPLQPGYFFPLSPTRWSQTQCWGSRKKRERKCHIMLHCRLGRKTVVFQPLEPRNQSKIFRPVLKTNSSFSKWIPYM